MEPNSGSLVRTSRGRGSVRTQDVSASYFDVLGIPLVAGRMFQPSDARGVVVINEAMARQHFAGDNPLGRTLVMARDESWQIIGIVRDAYISGLDRVHPLVFGQHDCERSLRVLIRSRRKRGRRRGACQGDRCTALIRACRSMRSRCPPIATAGWRRQRVIAAVAGIVSLLALVLASVGVFGVFAFVVQERTREIGIRMAIGANARLRSCGSCCAARAGRRRAACCSGSPAPCSCRALLDGYTRRRRPLRPGDVRGVARDPRGGGARGHLRAGQARHAGRSRDRAALRVSRASERLRCQAAG